MSIVQRFLFFILLFSIYFTAFAQIAVPTLTGTLSGAQLEEKVMQMGNECWRLREINSDSAIKIGKKALALAIEHNIVHQIARISNFVGVVYIHYLYDAKSAIPYFHRAIENSLKSSDSVQLAYTYNNLGDAFMLTGNAPLALEYAESSLSIFKKLDHLLGIAYAYVNLGLVYSLEEKYHLALKEFNQAKEIREKIGDKIGLASVLLELAKIYQKKGHLDKAMEFYEESYRQHLAINNVRYTAFCLNGMANIYYLQKQFDKAYEYFNRAIELNQKRKHNYGLIDDYIGLALVYAEQGKRKEGEKSLKKALEISNAMLLHSKILKTHETFSTFYQILNDYKNATRSLEQFLFIYDSLLYFQQFETLNEIQNNFLIKQKLNKAQQELKTWKIERKYLLIIIVLMIILVVVFFWRLRSHRNMNRQLHQMNQVKDKLFSVISHDLKSPFNSLLGFSEILVGEIEHQHYENAREYAGIIHYSAEENLKLLTNLLNWSRSQTGRIEYNPKFISIDHLFKELKEFFEVDAYKYGIQLDFKNSINQEVYGDTNILRIILINIISNALKYTKQGGQIQINANQTASHIIIRVEDNGIGIPEDTLNRLFDNLQSVSTSGLRDEKGTGLGLIICAELIQIHKGRIRAESELGKGSVFEIDFPVEHF